MMPWLHNLEVFGEIYLRSGFTEYITAFISVCAYVMLCFAAPAFYPDYFSNFSTETEITIEQGMSAGDAARVIKEAGLVRNQKLLVRSMVELGIDRTLKPGVYKLTAGPEASVANQLRNAKPEYNEFILIPGTRYNSIASRFISASGDVFTQEMSDDTNFPAEIRPLLPQNSKDRIAFLLPETYNLPPGRSLAKEFVKIASAEWVSRLGNIISSDITPEKLLKLATLASVVEGEAKLAEERPILAGIFLKRMEKHMRLQSCATVIYCWEERGVKKGSLTYNDLKVDSPYNTYKNAGLPPGPISVPSVASWKSAISPQTTDYLFFFATDKGNHIFSKTYAEHVAKQKKNN